MTTDMIYVEPCVMNKIYRSYSVLKCIIYIYTIKCEESVFTVRSHKGCFTWLMYVQSSVTTQNDTTQTENAIHGTLYNWYMYVCASTATNCEESE
jgi:hypothetical protein